MAGVLYAACSVALSVQGPVLRVHAGRLLFVGLAQAVADPLDGMFMVAVGSPPIGLPPGSVPGTIHDSGEGKPKLAILKVPLIPYAITGVPLVSTIVFWTYA